MRVSARDFLELAYTQMRDEMPYACKVRKIGKIESKKTSGDQEGIRKG